MSVTRRAWGIMRGGARRVVERVGSTVRGAQESDLSPSIHHRRLAETIVPANAYRGGDVAAWQAELRPVLDRVLGDRPTSKTPLTPRTLWTREHRLGRIEKLVFESEPGVDVPAYLCTPRDVRPPYPVMICLQGHTTGMHNSIAVARWNEATSIHVPGDRDLALGCLARGVAALCIEQRALGERTERAHTVQHLNWHPCTEPALHALLLGRTLAGERVHDVDRGIDLLRERGDFDEERIGVMGQSGGGTIALYSGAILPRVRLVIASGAFCSYKSALLDVFHCPDNYLPGVLRYADLPDIVGLLAPRPLVIVAARGDDLFPFASAEAGFAHVRRIYDAAGAAERCHFVAVDGGHSFYAKPAWAAAERYLR